MKRIAAGLGLLTLGFFGAWYGIHLVGQGVDGGPLYVGMGALVMLIGLATLTTPGGPKL